MILVRSRLHVPSVLKEDTSSGTRLLEPALTMPSTTHVALAQIRELLSSTYKEKKKRRLLVNDDLYAP